MSAFDRFMAFFCVYGLFLSFIIFEKDRNGNEKFRKAYKTVRNDHEAVENAQERSGTFRNAQERSGTLRNGERSGTVNGQERSGTLRNAQGR